MPLRIARSRSSHSSSPSCRVQSISSDGCTLCASTIICGTGRVGMGTCGVAAVCQGRTRNALYSEHLFPSMPYLVHLNSEFVLPVTPVCFAMPVRASTTLSCLAIEADRDRLPAAGGGPSVGRGAPCTGGAAFGPVGNDRPWCW